MNDYDKPWSWGPYDPIHNPWEPPLDTTFFPVFTGIDDCPLEEGVTYILSLLPKINDSAVALSAQRVFPALNMVMFTAATEDRNQMYVCSEKKARRDYAKIKKKLWLKLAEKTYDEVTK